MTIEEVQDHVCGLTLDPDEEVVGFVPDEGDDDDWEEEEPNAGISLQADIDSSVSCFLLGAMELEASFQKAGCQGGLEEANHLIETLHGLVENACAGVSTGSHTAQQRAAAYAPLRGRAWYTWTLDDVMPIIELLRDNALCHASSAADVPPDSEVFPLTKVLSHHWGINAYLDPYLVVAEGGTPMPDRIGPKSMVINPTAAGWTSGFVTNNRAHALMRADAWRQAGAPRVAMATFNAGTFIHF